MRAKETDATDLSLDKRDKIVHLTSLHPALDPRIFFREARAAVEAGYSVAVIAPCSGNRSYHGVELKAFPRVHSRIARLFAGSVRMWRMAMRERAQLYQFHDPELMLTGLLLRLSGKCVVYDVHEDLPRDVYNKDWLPRFSLPVLSRLLSGLEKAVGRVMSGVVAATPVIADRFPAEKTVCVRNFPLPEGYPTTRALDAGKKAMSAVYVGGLSEPRGLSNMLGAGEILVRDMPYKLILAGEFRPADKVRLVSHRSYVDYLGTVQPAAVAAILARAHLGVVLLQPLQSYIDALPLKLFEYMAAGLPVVASDFGIMRKVVAGYECGLLVPPDDPQAAAEAQKWLFEHPAEARKMGERGRRAVRTDFNWHDEARKLMDFYAGLIRRAS